MGLTGRQRAQEPTDITNYGSHFLRQRTRRKKVEKETRRENERHSARLYNILFKISIARPVYKMTEITGRILEQSVFFTSPI